MPNDSQVPPCPNDDGLVVSPGTPLYRALSRLERRSRIVAVCGIPGTGKSLVVGQLARLAHSEGRPVHLLQWDVARLAFESPWALEQFPEVDGITHPFIRRCCGMWARKAVYEWQRRHVNDDCILIIEAPLVGARFIELALAQKTVAEPTFTAPYTRFVVVVPSVRVRREIERARRRTAAAPVHASERADAAPHVMSGLWEEVLHAASELDLGRGRNRRYAPDLYRRVFRYVLRHRRAETLKIDELLPTGERSVHELGFWAKRLHLGRSEAEEILHQIYSRVSDPDELAAQMDELARQVSEWYVT